MAGKRNATTIILRGWQRNESAENRNVIIYWSRYEECINKVGLYIDRPTYEKNFWKN